MSQPTLTFTLTTSCSSSSTAAATRYGPRIGTLVSRRPSTDPNALAGSTAEIRIPTPNLITTTSRGVVPHLSRDHARASAAIRWVNVPFETFLEHNPPIPLLQPGPTPLHTLLGFTPSTHLLALTARDPASAHPMPPNSNTHISVSSLRGVRKLSPTAWRAYVQGTKPDVVLALSDVPFTDPPYSQKRLTKSVERSVAWLAGLLASGAPEVPSSSSAVTKTSSTAVTSSSSTTTISSTSTSPTSFTATTPPSPTHLPPIFVHMAGGASPAARKAFSSSLTEPLFGPEAAAVRPLRSLDEGVAGYVFDLVPLRLELAAAGDKTQHARARAAESPSEVVPAPTPTAEQITPLLLASLAPLSPSPTPPKIKPIIITTPSSPHEILHYITHVGADLFDASFAQRAADVGVALDFVFPVPSSVSVSVPAERKQIGHNLYQKTYALDFAPFADAFRGTAAGAPSSSSSSSARDGKAPETEPDTRPICPCAACSPVASPERLYHGVDAPSFSDKPDSRSPSYTQNPQPTHRPPHTRAYIHHLLHTHEMSAHALLALHNLAVLDAFFAGVRGVLGASSSASSMSASASGSAASTSSASTPSAGAAQSAPTTPTTSPPPSTSPKSWDWHIEVHRFAQTYDAELRVFEDAERRWREVDQARGKGRLAREREKEVGRKGEKEKELGGKDKEGNEQKGEGEECALDP